MQVNAYLVLMVVMGIAFFMAGILALYWAAKTGQFQNFEQNAKSIFTEEEPEGIQTDFFPGANNLSQKSSSK